MEPPSAEPGHGPRLVTLIQRLDLRVVEVQINGGDGVFQVVHFGRPYDGRVNPGLTQYPGQRNPSGRDPPLGGHLEYRLDDGLAFFAVERAAELVGL